MHIRKNLWRDTAIARWWSDYRNARRRRRGTGEGLRLRTNTRLAGILLAAIAAALALYYGVRTHTAVDVQARAAALNATSQALERLFIAAAQEGEDWGSVLNKLRTSDDYRLEVSGAAGQPCCLAHIVEATDGTGTNLLTAEPPSHWSPPVTVVAEVQYKDDNGTHRAQVSFTYITP